jgi:LysM repeat protein
MKPQDPAPAGAFTDISWMLQSEKVSDRQLGEALVERFYDEFCQLGSLLLSSLFTNPDQIVHRTQAAILKVITTTVLNRSQYWGEEPIAWYLTRELIAELCGKSESRFSAWCKTTPAGRLRLLLLLLVYHFGLTPAAAAAIIRIPPEHIDHLLAESEAAAASLTETAGRLVIPVHITVARTEAGSLAAFRLGERPGRFAAASQAQIAAKIASRVEGKRRPARFRFGSREGILVCIFILSVFTFLWSAKILQPVDQRVLLLTPSPGLGSTKQGSVWFTYRIQAGDSLPEIARRAGISEQVILQNNALPDPDQLSPGQTIRLPLIPLLRQRSSEAPPAPTASLPALTIHSPLAEILARGLAGARQWQTLWAEIYSVSYGDPGYAGPPLSGAASQIWAGQPDQLLFAQNIEPEGPVILTWQIGDLLIERYRGMEDLSGGFRRDGLLDFFTYLHLDPQANTHLAVVGEGAAAGRPCLVLEGKQESETTRVKVWIDSATGVILRRQAVDAHSGVVLSERIVLDIRYDLAIPPGVFDPISSWHAGRQYEVSAVVPEDGSAPAWAAARPVPEPFAYELAESPELVTLPVALVWPNEWDYFISGAYGDPGNQPRKLIYVYAGSDFKGWLGFGDERFRACRRSPDGARVAVTSTTFQPGGTASLHWFMVNNPGQAGVIHFSSSAMPGRHLAFAPDSTRLAFAGCPEGEECGLFRLDLRSGKATLLLPENQGEFQNTYFAWSDSGDAVGLSETIFDETGRTTCKILVVSAADGEILYAGAPGDCPAGYQELQAWGVDLVLEQSVLGCMWPAP